MLYILIKQLSHCHTLIHTLSISSLPPPFSLSHTHVHVRALYDINLFTIVIKTVVVVVVVVVVVDVVVLYSRPIECVIKPLGEIDVLNSGKPMYQTILTYTFHVVSDINIQYNVQYIHVQCMSIMG